jgi:hypothetical protein
MSTIISKQLQKPAQTTRTTPLHPSSQPVRVANPVPRIDFIETYGRYADVLETPRETHEWVARQIVASVLNQNGVTIPHGALKYSLDLWTLLLSGSGFGRSTLIGMSRPILDGAGVIEIERNSHWGSQQALYQEAADHPTGLWTWGEMSEKLRLLNQSQFSGAKEWITDRYDNFRTPDAVTYRRAGKVSDTPTISYSQAPRINILATSSEDWFFQNLAREDSTGGFIPRWILIPIKDAGKIIPTPLKTDSLLADQLGKRLRQIAALKGEANISGILDDYEPWYRATRQRFEAQPSLDLAMAYFNRHRVHVLKLAVIYEASFGNSLKVSKSSWNRAVETCSQLEQSIFSLLSTGMSATGHTLERMTEKVVHAGVEGLSRSDFTRAFQDMHQAMREDLLATLVESRKIIGFLRQTPGRPVTTLVHESVVDDYKKTHPKDRALHLWTKK